MSGGSAKETRRQLRRSLGPDVVALLEQHEQGILAAHAALAAFVQKSFWKRLVWLVTGRV